ncbi:hypothetical protein C8F01DRAFT_1372900 [Mycena amicta]|nr:hypothetical protein C8F01DRAFT_1372900 [Mycena amicta]
MSSVSAPVAKRHSLSARSYPSRQCVALAAFRPRPDISQCRAHSDSETCPATTTYASIQGRAAKARRVYGALSLGTVGGARTPSRRRRVAPPGGWEIERPCAREWG